MIGGEGGDYIFLGFFCRAEFGVVDQDDMGVFRVVLHARLVLD